MLISESYLVFFRRASVVQLIEEIKQVVREYQGVYYPHSHLARTFDNVLAVLLLFTCCITPFEIAYLESGINPLFVINRIVDVGFLTDVSRVSMSLD
jgi:hypothetical protein